jgi:hypothetical protein
MPKRSGPSWCRVAVVSVALLPFAALASTPEADGGSPAQGTPQPAYGYEINMGFSGGAIDPSSLPLIFGSGAAQGVSGATGLTAPFGGPSVRSLITAGPAWETRTVNRHVRFTLGVQRPFAQFRQGALDGETNAGGSPLVGSPVRVSPRSLSLWVFRLGLGAEYTFGRVTPFVDLLGDVQLASADVVVEGQRGTYTSSSFAMVGRAGVRVRLDEHLFVGVAAEFGLLGAQRFGGSVVAGWFFPID